MAGQDCSGLEKSRRHFGRENPYGITIIRLASKVSLPSKSPPGQDTRIFENIKQNGLAINNISGEHTNSPQKHAKQISRVSFLHALPNVKTRTLFNQSTLQHITTQHSTSHLYHRICTVLGISVTNNDPIHPSILGTCPTAQATRHPTIPSVLTGYLTARYCNSFVLIG